MDFKSAINRGAFLGSAMTLGAILFAFATHWFITPIRHPDASRTDQILVALQAAFGVGVAAWAWLRLRAEQR